jgi:hypothetical protein
MIFVNLEDISTERKQKSRKHERNIERKKK